MMNGNSAAVHEMNLHGVNDIQSMQALQLAGHSAH